MHTCIERRLDSRLSTSETKHLWPSAASGWLSHAIPAQDEASLACGGFGGSARADQHHTTWTGRSGRYSLHSLDPITGKFKPHLAHGLGDGKGLQSTADIGHSAVAASISDTMSPRTCENGTLNTARPARQLQSLSAPADMNPTHGRL